MFRNGIHGEICKIRLTSFSFFVFLFTLRSIDRFSVQASSLQIHLVRHYYERLDNFEQQNVFV